MAGLATNYILTLTACAAEVGKAKKVKGIGSAILPFCVVSFIPAKTDYAGLLGMQLKVKLCKSFPSGRFSYPFFGI